MMNQIFTLGAMAFLLLSCSRKESQPINKFTDSTLARIADLQDRRDTDSLLVFIVSNAPKYREAAALAFGSVQDTLAVDMLARLFLSDPDPSVRTAAAFALGQTGGAKAAETLLARREQVSNPVVAEALGKVVGVTDQLPGDISSWALYRIALRVQSDSTHIQLAMKLLQHADADERLGAIHFFSRGPSRIDKAEQELLRLLRDDPSVHVRMAAASALRKINNPQVMRAISEALQTEPDYRIRVNLVRALQPYPLGEVSDARFASLSDENINVAIAAAEIIRQSAKPADFAGLTQQARKTAHWRVRANLYGAALSVSSDKELSEEIVHLIEASDNPYEKAALTEVLSYSPMQYEFVKTQLFTSGIPVVRTSSATALAGMNRHRTFAPSMQKSFIDIYQSALRSDDPAVIGIIAATLSDPTLGYKKLLSDYRFLYEAKARLQLPRDVEALQPLEVAIAYFEGTTAPTVQNEFNHPIDWAFVKSVPHDQRVVVKTSKGDIEMQMLVEEAPGSVANFLKLAKTAYFNAKNFHRVVPNFVIQGGCNRGDGWGSEDYSIRSEFSTRKYKEGSVGMASAGKDTEGTQWFITHSPTPHLDGRYTIFAEVVAGMDVVHRIEVGDRIIAVEVIGY